MRRLNEVGKSVIYAWDEAKIETPNLKLQLESPSATETFDSALDRELGITLKETMHFNLGRATLRTKAGIPDTQVNKILNDCRERKAIVLTAVTVESEEKCGIQIKYTKTQLVQKSTNVEIMEPGLDEAETETEAEAESLCTVMDVDEEEDADGHVHVQESVEKTKVSPATVTVAPAGTGAAGAEAIANVGIDITMVQIGPSRSSKKLKKKALKREATAIDISSTTYSSASKKMKRDLKDERPRGTEDVAGAAVSSPSSSSSSSKAKAARAPSAPASASISTIPTPRPPCPPGEGWILTEHERFPWFRYLRDTQTAQMQAKASDGFRTYQYTGAKLKLLSNEIEQIRIKPHDFFNTHRKSMKPIQL